jgi:hypothetical protein
VPRDSVRCPFPPYPYFLNRSIHDGVIEPITDSYHSGVICSILRFRYVDGLTDTDDFFWSATNISMWSTVECGASIIAGCLATLRPFLKSVIINARTSSTLSGCVKHVSQSFHSSQPSDARSLPHISTQTKHGHDTGLEAKDMASTTKPTAARTEEISFVEFLARPGEEVITLNEQRSRGSTEPILQEQDVTHDFPWPVQKNQSRKRQTIHASWTMRRGVASDGRTAGGNLV